MKTDEFPEIETRTYEKIKFAMLIHASKEFLLDADFGLVEDFLNKTLILRFTASVWATQDTESVMDAEQVPLTWWDGAKETLKEWLESHQMGWFAGAIRTVNHRIINTEVKHWHVYPNVKFESPHNDVKISYLKGQNDN